MLQHLLSLVKVTSPWILATITAFLSLSQIVAHYLLARRHRIVLKQLQAHADKVASGKPVDIEGLAKLLNLTQEYLANSKARMKGRGE